MDIVFAAVIGIGAIFAFKGGQKKYAYAGFAMVIAIIASLFLERQWGSILPIIVGVYWLFVAVNAIHKKEA